MFPRDEFVLVSTRPFNEEEQEEARRFFASKPRRVLWAWLVGVGLWPFIIGAAVALGGAFAPDDNSSSPLLFPLMIAFVTAPAIGICLGKDVWLEKNLLRFVLSGRTLEVWEPRPDLPEERRGEWPHRVEIVSGTTEIWSEEKEFFAWNEGDEDDLNTSS